MGLTKFFSSHLALAKGQRRYQSSKLVKPALHDEQVNGFQEIGSQNHLYRFTA